MTKYDSSKYLGKVVELSGKGSVFSGKVEGIVLPNENKDLFVLKLSSGYNIAVKCENIDSVKVLGDSSESPKKPKVSSNIDLLKGLPKVGIVTMGGTIASRVDYKTGGVSFQFTAEDLVNAIPEVKTLANLECIPFNSIWSENITRKDWLDLAKKIESLSKENYNGVIITMGTDFMHYTASALSFILEELNMPVIFVGSQRSSDRPSSDAAYNLLGALTFIKESKKAGVFVAMHNTSDDKVIAIHLGTKVRKLHTSRRDAFKSVNISPVALVHLDLSTHNLNKNEIVFNSGYDSLANIKDCKTKAITKLSDEVALLKFVPDFDTKLFDYYLKNFKVLIVEGSGFGHLSDPLLELVKKNAGKTIIFMTSQCIYGRTNLNIYTQGRKEQELGIIPLGDMLAETAYNKASYVLGKTQKKEEIVKMMTTNLKGELSERTEYSNEEFDN
jgi:glutamyl-tRNA(Gln) amidotransferase subunit D